MPAMGEKYNREVLVLVFIVNVTKYNLCFFCVNISIAHELCRITFLGDKIKKADLDGVCTMHRGMEVHTKLH
jgi:hypothetical protein